MSTVSPIAYLEADFAGEVKQFSLDPGGILHIGRSDRNDLVLNNDLTSRSHAMLQDSGGGLFYISDLGSRNGTFVNGARISAPVILRPGDQIRIGYQEFTFHQTAPIDYSAAETADDLNSTNVVFAQSLITVLVADIRDFTVLSQRIDAAKLSQVAGAFFREAGKALQDQGAWAQKYIGDAVMAVWIHKRSEPDPRDLLKVLEGLLKLSQIAAGLQTQFGLEWPVSFGAAINTGWASVGNAGSIAFADYTALGETVNRAFRLESSTREIFRDIAIGQSTHDFLTRAAPIDEHFTPVTVQLKGYDEPVMAYAADLASLPPLIARFTCS